MFAYVLFILSVLIAPPKQPDVILVTIDGTRWQEIFKGTDPWLDRGHHHLTERQLVPNLYNYFVDQGIAVGKDTPIIASGPNHISLPGYLEITRGHPSTDCQLNTCNPTIDRSVFLLFKSPAVFSSWQNIKKTVPSNANVGGNIPDTYRMDNATELASILYLDRNAPDFFWVSLGDTDEFAHQNNYARYIEALRMSDAFIGYLVNRYPNSTIIVTCDHGRSANFRDHGQDKASEKVWLMMRGPNVPKKGFVSASPLSLSNIYQTIKDIEQGTQSPDSILSNIH